MHLYFNETLLLYQILYLDIRFKCKTFFFFLIAAYLCNNNNAAIASVKIKKMRISNLSSLWFQHIKMED